MVTNKDQFSRRAKGRFFAVTAAELLGAIKTLGFNHSEYRKRVDLILRNPRSDHELGMTIAAFLPADCLLVYSIPDHFPSLRGATLIHSALREFRAIDKQPKTQLSRIEITSYRAYLGSNNQLIITKLTRAATLGKYRGDAKFSNAFKPTHVNTEEKILRTIAVT